MVSELRTGGVARRRRDESWRGRRPWNTRRERCGSERGWAVTGVSVAPARGLCPAPGPDVRLQRRRRIHGRSRVAGTDVFSARCSSFPLDGSSTAVGGWAESRSRPRGRRRLTDRRLTVAVAIWSIIGSYEPSGKSFRVLAAVRDLPSGRDLRRHRGAVPSGLLVSVAAHKRGVAQSTNSVPDCAALHADTTHRSRTAMARDPRHALRCGVHGQVRDARFVLSIIFRTLQELMRIRQ